MAEPEEDDDYMADLSRFLPPEASGPLPKKVSNSKASSVAQPYKKKPRAPNWQEQRKIDRERKQQEEDEKTLANIEAPIPQSNVGFKLLKQMGYTPGTALGKEGSGRAEPVKVDIRRSRAGIGREDPSKEKRKREERRWEEEKRNEESLMEEFGSRKKSQWQIRRVVVNYNKAKAVLEQLENKEVVLPDKSEEEGEDGEEELITEEDLQEILMKLRDEHQYCLFCGCQYESMEELLSSCPGIDEDDH
ncbi:uncharacterized protein LOC126800030 [Argentina anserina]|uniref:uncharacterized protein LOC126800030 n=1 Tax=Argentina anserina TaxID=57926 RepID=UPI00217661EC|nr:uncharacterized protein LOC126800030 [Potentilla anserina]